MTVNELLGFIPNEIFQRLAAETRVDNQVKKLSGELMFKLILFSMLNSDKVSLRVMETYLHSAQFKFFTGYDILDSRYNSIRDRICTIESEYFERLFTEVFAIYNKVLKEQTALCRVDSTMVSVAARLFTGGITNNSKTTRFLKYGINLKGSLPCSVKIFKDPCYASDDRALAEVVHADHLIEGNVVVFDRGLRSRTALDQMSADSKFFITRGYQAIRLQPKKSIAIPDKPLQGTLTIDSDEIGFLINKNDHLTKHTYRIIKGTIDKTGEPICFVTNMTTEDCYTIALLYKQRWEIEVFFKFLKQHLNVNHLVSRTENGMKVMIYMTMILAILILTYKKLNNIKGYKLAKLRFEIELDNEMIRTIVIFCGGNPDKAAHIFKSRSG